MSDKQTFTDWAVAVLRLLADMIEKLPVSQVDLIATTLREIIALASHDKKHYSLLESPMSREKMEQPMPGDISTVNPVQLLDIKAPRQYFKYFCHYCFNEWVGYEIRDEGGKLQLPSQCNWCKSTVWHDPEKAAYQRMLRARRIADGRQPKRGRKKKPDQ